MARVDEVPISEEPTLIALRSCYDELFRTCNSDIERWALLESSPQLFDGCRHKAATEVLSPSKKA
eukprot:4823622-Amphidinium_carterae.1